MRTWPKPQRKKGPVESPVPPSPFNQCHISTKRNKVPPKLEDCNTVQSVRTAFLQPVPETAFDLSLDGVSWMDYIARRGYDVYLMDVRGYGHSTRPPEIDAPAERNPPFADTETAVRDIGAVVDYILARRHVNKLDILGWSWGTATTATYASANP